MDQEFKELSRKIAAGSTPELRGQITRLALRMKQGIFIAWQGTHGAPPESSTIEIEQQLSVGVGKWRPGLRPPSSNKATALRVISSRSRRIRQRQRGAGK